MYSGICVSDRDIPGHIPVSARDIPVSLGNVLNLFPDIFGDIPAITSDIPVCLGNVLNLFPDISGDIPVFFRLFQL